MVVSILFMCLPTSSSFLEELPTTAPFSVYILEFLGIQARPIISITFLLCVIIINVSIRFEITEFDITYTLHAGKCPEACESCLAGSC